MKWCGFLFVLFLLMDITAAHGPVAHEGQAVPTQEQTLPGELGQYSVILGHTPEDAIERQEIEFQFRVVQESEILDPLLGSRIPVAADRTHYRFRFLSEDLFLSEAAVPLTEGAGDIFTVRRRFVRPGSYSLQLEVSEEGGSLLNFEFPFQVRPNSYGRWASLMVNGTLGFLCLIFVFFGMPDSSALRSGRRRLQGAFLLLLIFFFAAANLWIVPILSDGILAYSQAEHGPIALLFSDERQPEMVEIEPSQVEMLGIQTTLVTEADFTEHLAVQGRFFPKPQLSAVVTAPLWGRIDFAGGSLFPGRRVRKGQLLFNVVLELNQSERNAMLDRFEEIKSSSEQANARTQAAEEALQRVRQLVEEKKIPRQELAWASRRLEASREESGVLKEQLARYQEIMRWRDPRKTPVAAPIDGNVIALHVVPGELNPDGEARELLSIVDLSRLWIEAGVSEGDVGRVLKSRSARIYPVAYPDLMLTGRLQAILPELDSESRLLTAIFEVSNQGEKLKLGMSARVEIEANAGGKGSAVPRSALSKDQTGPVVFVEESFGVYQKRPVIVGSSTEQLVQIKSGLRPGERVVTKGLYQLQALQNSPSTVSEEDKEAKPESISTKHD